MREVILYSDLEFDHWVLVETNPLVETYCEQPCEISFTMDGKLHSTIFDMWIRYKDGTEVFREVKYSTELEGTHPRNYRTQRQIKAQNKWCEQNGYQHQVVTEKEIRKCRYELENRLRMLSVLKSSTEPTWLNALYVVISKQRISLGQLHAHFPQLQFSDIANAALWMMYYGRIVCNLSEIFGKGTEVWVHEPN